MTTAAPESKSSAKSDKPPSPAARLAKSVAESVEAKTTKVRQSAEKVGRKASATVAREPTRRKLTDPEVMRALAHPARVELIETLLREGPLTATAAAAILDDSPGNMSWHLNVLAKYGFVEEAEGGRGRARPWRLVNLGTEFTEEDDNPELNMAAETMSRVIIDRNREQGSTLAERAFFVSAEVAQGRLRLQRGRIRHPRGARTARVRARGRDVQVPGADLRQREEAQGSPAGRRDRIRPPDHPERHRKLRAVDAQ